MRSADVLNASEVMMTTRWRSIPLLFFLILSLGSRIFAQSDPSHGHDSRGIITGKILIRGGGPLAGGMVFFYDALTGPAPFRNQIRRLPTFKADIDADGNFRAELSPGKYYMKAMKRNSGDVLSLNEGDYIYFSVDDKGKAKEYAIKSGETLNIGTIAEAVPYKQTEEIIITAIQGVITDTKRNPVKGVSVFAFLDPTLSGKPLYFSKRTGPDGAFELRVPEGTYYLRARSKLRGGPPGLGEFFGVFGGNTPVSVSIKDGEIEKGIYITVTTFPGRGPAAGAGPR